MGPALHQLYPEEVAAATAYFDLFLRTVSEPSLVYVFLKFIFTCKYEGSRIINTLLNRYARSHHREFCNQTMYRTNVGFYFIVPPIFDDFKTPIFTSGSVIFLGRVESF
jgi:hypothetical protein